MKLSVVFSALLLMLLLSGCEEKEKVVIPYEEVPEDVFHVELCETLNGTVMSMLSESSNNRDKYPQLFTDNAQGQIVLSKESDVYISFVTSSASVPSTLGFYAYKGSAPGKDGIERKVAFPHVSNSVLNSGDSRRLGHFEAGTVIGFFLVVGGYSTANQTINWDKPTFWTNYSWNDGSYRQHVLFRESQCNNIVMAFEDKNISHGSDSDFNDIVFVISDNNKSQASSAFDVNAVPSM